MIHASCELLRNESVDDVMFFLEFAWKGPMPKAGQFFMIRPKRSGVFLGRPICAESWFEFPGKSIIDEYWHKYECARPRDGEGAIRFFIAMHGKGTRELADMNARGQARPGEEAELIGPLGNAWTDFLPPAESLGGKPVALIGGGVGLAPLAALLHEEPGHGFDVYAGFKTSPRGKEEKDAFLGAANLKAKNVFLATEDGLLGKKGFVTDFLEPGKYAAVCACGPKPMMKVVADKCAAAAVPCFVSMDQRMACGVGACLGCTVRTVNGNRRCCADGPIFDAREIIFDG